MMHGTYKGDATYVKYGVKRSLRGLTAILIQDVDNPDIVWAQWDNVTKLPLNLTHNWTFYAKKDWTQFVFGQLLYENNQAWFQAIKWPSRLKSIAAADCILSVSEGIEEITKGTNVKAVRLNE